MGDDIGEKTGTSSLSFLGSRNEDREKLICLGRYLFPKKQNGKQVVYEVPGLIFLPPFFYQEKNEGFCFFDQKKAFVSFSRKKGKPHAMENCKES
jgi:hypothetical protein